MRITFHQTENENDTKQGTKRLMSYVGLGSRMLCSAGMLSLKKEAFSIGSNSTL
jgi:hypothetical protein